MIGRTVSGYRVLEHLGVGGMGTVYSAEDTRSGQIVALKFPHAGLLRSTSARLRYRTNAGVAAGLDHPRIVRVYDVCEDGDEIFVVMELVDGRRLRDRLDAGPLPLRDTLAIGGAVAEALAYAHGRSIVHGDVKPENILVGSGGLMKLADFDAAVLVSSLRPDSDWPEEMTAHYMAPELASGVPRSVRSDLYSLGVVLYEMVSGMPPFAGESLGLVMHRIATETPPPLPAAAPGVVHELVGALLEREPGGRPAAADVVATLARFAGSS